MKRINEDFESILSKYLEHHATEAESLKILDMLIESIDMRARLNIMASGFNQMVKLRPEIDNSN